MPALSASKHNQKMKELYVRLVSKGKNKKLALIAVASKQIDIIYFVASHFYSLFFSANGI
jgi:hypothetical protein